MSRQFDTGAAPHFPPHATVDGVMRQVLYALVPGIVAYTWFFGPGVLVQILLSIIFALTIEAAMLKAGNREREIIGHAEGGHAVPGVGEDDEVSAGGGACGPPG